MDDQLEFINCIKRKGRATAVGGDDKRWRGWEPFYRCCWRIAPTTKLPDQ